MNLEDRLKARARQLGFELVGIATAAPADGFDRFLDWLDRGCAGEMVYLRRQASARRHPDSILPAVRSVVMLGMNYHCKPGGANSESARIASYALGQDYHDVLRSKLNELLAWVQTESPDAHGRGVVDTAPLLERDFARRAGLGWVGKNTMLLNKRLGSFFFLGALLLDLALAPDSPFDATHCGSCTACLDACPTHAFLGPYQLDSRLCVSYLTIELRGSIPEALRPGVGSWLFGCDICQDVCPWNRKAPLGTESALRPRDDLEAIDPINLFKMDAEEFRRHFRHTALWRTKRQGLLRNAAIVLGNTGGAGALPALEQATGDVDPVVQEAARWALARIRERLCR